MAIMKTMSMRWFALILLLCLALPVAGWASARAACIDTQQTDRGVLPTEAFAKAPVRQSTIAAVVDHEDADCDDGDCPDGHCKHGCYCGCDMGSCASPNGALFGEPWTLPVIAATDAISPPVAQRWAATRATSLLRPPIA